MLFAKRDSILDNIEQLTNIDGRRLKTIEEHDLPDLRRDRDILASTNRKHNEGAKHAKSCIRNCTTRSR